MAAACPLPLIRDPKQTSETARRSAEGEAEAIWFLVVDAQRDDLDLLRRRWPDRESAESRGAIERLKRRSAPGGDADEAMGAVHEAYGGSGRVPSAVRRRLERYVQEQLGGRPWPERDPTEDLDEPALLRKQRRASRAATTNDEPLREEP